MSKGQSVLGVAVALLLAFAGVASGAGVSRASDSTCGSLNSGKGVSAPGSELRDVAVVFAGEA